MRAFVEMTKKSLITVATMLAIMISATALAQENYYVVNGVVKDAKTKHKLVFANVSVPGTTIGIITNSDGEFTLKVPKSAGDEFEISHLGYENKKFSLVQEVAGQIYYVSPSSVQLQGVIVRPSDPRSIVSQAISHIYDNYSLKPMTLTGFYRETVKQRRDYLSIAEAITSIYKASYVGIESDKAKILKGRKGENVRKADTLIVKMQGGPSVALYADVVKSPNIILSKEDIDDYDYKMVDMVNIDNKSNYVIAFTPRVEREYPLYTGTFYITVDELAITMLQFSLDLRDLSKATRMLVKRKPKGLIFEPQNTNYLVTYKQIDGRYHLNYIRSEVKFNSDWRKRIFKTNYTIMSELAITQRESENVEKIPTKEAYRPNAVFAEKVNEYFDEDYWGNYNTIEPDESIQSAIDRFNKRIKKN